MQVSHQWLCCRWVIFLHRWFKKESTVPNVGASHPKQKVRTTAAVVHSLCVLNIIMKTKNHHFLFCSALKFKLFFYTTKIERELIKLSVWSSWQKYVWLLQVLTQNINTKRSHMSCEQRINFFARVVSASRNNRPQSVSSAHLPISNFLCWPWCQIFPWKYLQVCLLQENVSVWML